MLRTPKSFNPILVLASLVLIAQISISPVNAFGFHDVVNALRSFRSVLGENTTENESTTDQEHNREIERERVQERIEKEKEKFASRSGELKERFASKSAELKEKVCENRKELAEKRANHVSDLTNKTVDVFSNIASKVEKYYTEKLVPSGKTLPNYDSLVADIDAKKAALLTALNNAKSDIPTVNCESGEVRTDITHFKTDTSKVRIALQEYRKSINNLIVAVRSLTGKTESGKLNTGSPSATVTP